MTSEKAKQQIEIIYPESDGKPIGETGHEYFIFDPDEDRPESRFCGFRLREGRYVPIPPEDSEGRRLSQELGTWVVPDGTNLRVIAPQTGSPLLNAWEAFTYANDEPMRTEREARTHGSMPQRRN